MVDFRKALLKTRILKHLRLRGEPADYLGVYLLLKTEDVEYSELEVKSALCDLMHDRKVKCEAVLFGYDYSLIEK